MGKSQQKTETLLHFLAQETYSDYHNIQIVLGYKNKSTPYRLLKKLLTEKKIQKHDYQNKYTLYGLTALGIKSSKIPNTAKTFRVSQLKNRNIEKHLLLQQVKHAFPIGNWVTIKTTEWRKEHSSLKKPTQIIETIEGKIALEIESHIPKRRGLKRKFEQMKEWEESGLFKSILYITSSDKMNHVLKMYLRKDKIEKLNSMHIESIEALERLNQEYKEA